MFHSYFEWGSAIGILFLFEGHSPLESVKSFLIGYLAFISIYEIGYIVNDQFSEKMEESPRNRQDTELSNLWIAVWMAVRISVFLLVTFGFGFNDKPMWWIFYAALVLSFLLHNSIQNADYRLISFFNLSVLRFLAPAIAFLSFATIQLIFPVILINYSLYRTIIYADSKKLLNLKSRKEPLFNLSFFLMTFIVVVVYSSLAKSFFPLILSGYFSFFMLIYYLKFSLFKR